MMLERPNFLPPVYAANQKHYAEVFYQACVNGDFELAASMLRCGVNLSVKFEHGESLLHIACAKSFYGLVQLLIKFGCNEFLKDRFGRTALHYAAASSNSAPIVRYLIEKNTFTSGDGESSHENDELTREFLNTRDVFGKTPLHLACENNCKEPVRVILSSGLADLNTPDHENNTPLTTAFFASHWELFEMLVKSGSLLHPSVLRHICNSSNLSAFNIIMRYYDSKTLAHLIDEFADDNSFLYLSIRAGGSIELVARLFQIGVRLTRKDCVDIHADFKSLLASIKSSASPSPSQQEKFAFYLECFVLMAKHYAVERRIQLTYSDLYRMSAGNLDLSDTLAKVDLNDLECVLNVAFIVYLDVLFDLASCLFAQLEACVRGRLLYMSALVVYSGQLNLKKKYVQKWLQKKLASVPSRGSTNDELNELRAKLQSIFLGSLTAPWSLQMLCRTAIKKNLKNVDYVLNDRSLVKSLNIPNICVRYLKFEYI